VDASVPRDFESARNDYQVLITKIQAPENVKKKIQAPSSKLQRNIKSQAPNQGAELPWGLGFGAWILPKPMNRFSDERSFNLKSQASNHRGLPCSLGFGSWIFSGTWILDLGASLLGSYANA
jgi:hypothetical protein